MSRSVLSHQGDSGMRVYCAVAQPPEGGAPVMAITTVHIEDYVALHEAFVALYRAADEAHEEHNDYPTDMTRGQAYFSAMDRLGAVLASTEGRFPASALGGTP